MKFSNFDERHKFTVSWSSATPIRIKKVSPIFLIIKVLKTKNKKEVFKAEKKWHLHKGTLIQKINHLSKIKETRRHGNIFNMLKEKMWSSLKSVSNQTIKNIKNDEKIKISSNRTKRVSYQETCIIRNVKKILQTEGK